MMSLLYFLEHCVVCNDFHYLSLSNQECLETNFIYIIYLSSLIHFQNIKH